MSLKDIHDYIEKIILETNKHLEYKAKPKHGYYVYDTELPIFISDEPFKTDKVAYTRVVNGVYDHYSAAGYIVERRGFGLLLSW